MRDYKSIEESAIRLGLDRKLTPVIYHYTSLETSKLILKDAKLKMSDPHNFNDPFDIHPSLIRFDIDNQGFIDFIREKKPSLDDEEIEKHINNYLASKPTFVNDICTELLSLQKENLGVVCYSEDYDNALMWSHYADKHTGICIGFKTFPLEGCILMPVIYKTEMVQANLFDNTHNPYTNWCFLKSHIWKYEKEVRALCIDVIKYCDENRLCSFNKLLVNEIYVGLNAPKGTEQAIYEILKENGYPSYNLIKIERMKINPKTYSFVK